MQRGQFIVLDLFNSDIVNAECDENGNTLYFDTEKEALAHAEDLQEPVVVELPFYGKVVRSYHALLNVVLCSGQRQRP